MKDCEACGLITFELWLAMLATFCSDPGRAACSLTVSGIHELKNGRGRGWAIPDLQDTPQEKGLGGWLA